MKFLLFKTEKPKQFEYKPRYYDPEQAELEERRKKMGLSPEQSNSERLRMQMQHEWNRRQERKKRQKNNTLRLLLFAGLVIVLLMFILR